MADTVLFDDCLIAGSLEIDKILGSVILDNCLISGGLTSDGAGALAITIHGTSVCGDFRINPRTRVNLSSVTSFGNFSLNAEHGGIYTDDRMLITTLTAGRK
jgi:hypothetical protein